MWRCPRALFAPRVRHQYAQSALTTAPILSKLRRSRTTRQGVEITERAASARETHGGLHHAQGQDDATPFPGDNSRRHGDRDAVCARRPRRRQADDGVLGSLGARRQQHHDRAGQRVGREGEGRGLDRLHHLGREQEPAHHRRRVAGEIRARYFRLPDLGAAGARQESRAGRRRHGRADQAERPGQSDGRLPRHARTVAGSRCRPPSAARSRGRARASIS